ncbi:MAG: DNA recombination protein RmuC [Bacteroidales bacterium]|nr:DNA recombination protein RmuC [Bacteroidales bacterium]MBQ6689780.1 DNA recombination protein RmuC [Bacteroidales bacterium]
MIGTSVYWIAAVVLLFAVAVVLAIALFTARKDKENSLSVVKDSYERTIEELNKGHERTVCELKDSHEKSIAELKKSHEDALNRQLETVKAQVTAESEKLLKAREEELERRAKLTFETLAGGLDRNIKDMKEAFELNRKTHTETSQTLKVNLDNAVKSLKEQTVAIGDKADNLADALRGKNKTQGNWGEIILDNLFTNEGMREGRDYDKEETLRDERGNVVYNEDTSRRMRPDYILHYPDGNDVVIDSKVVLAALDDYYNAETEAAKADAMARNLASMKEQVKNLAKKDYSRYLKPGHRMLDYVIMFVPVYSALRLAYEADRNLWHDAYSQGVLITTEETLMPFLRMIRIAWTSHEQVANQKQIIAAAETVLARVSDFCTAHAKMGRKLEEALDQYEACDRKIRERGQSIVGAANKLIDFGVPKNPKKPLPAEIGMEEIED